MVRRNVVARVLMIGSALDTVKEGTLDTLFGAFIPGILRADAHQLGLIVSVQVLEGLVTGRVVPHLITRRAPHVVIGWGFVFSGLFLLTVALLLLAVTGLLITAAHVEAGTLPDNRSSSFT